MIGRRTQTAAWIAAATVLLVWLPQIPLGVSGEWAWPRVPSRTVDALDWFLGGLMAALVAAGYAALCWAGGRRLRGCGRPETAAWLSGLVIAGCFLLAFLQHVPPTPYGLSKVPWVIYFPRSSGYFFEARYHIGDVAAFLAGYEKWLAEGGDVLHLGTHPPGLFLLHRGLIVLCRELPAVTDLLLALQPEAVVASFDAIEQQTVAGASSLERADRAAIWLAALITQLAAAAAIVPLFLLLRRSFSRMACWAAVAMWPLVPALAVFLPKSDALYPLLCATALWLWLSGWTKRSALRCAAAGLVFWAGMMFSLAVLPAAVLGALVAVIEGWLNGGTERSDRWRRRLVIGGACAGAAFLLATWVFSIVFDTNLVRIWLWNYRNHARFYDEYARTYWKWLLINPLELMFAAGGPLVVLAVVGATNTSHLDEPTRKRHLAASIGIAVVWGLIWLSGKNMGEAARLWLFLQPWLLWLAAPCFESPHSDAHRAKAGATRPLRGWMTVLALQAAVALLTVARIDGFHLSDL